MFFSLVLIHFSSFGQFNSTDRLILDLPFNGNAQDVSGNNNHGIVYGATLTEDRFGSANSAYDFQLANHSSIEIPYSPTLDSITTTTGYTISGWFKAHSWESGGTPLLALIERHNVITDEGTEFIVFPFGTYTYDNLASYNFELEQWYQVAIALNVQEDSIRYYVNGVNIYTVGYLMPIDTSNHGPYSIGTSLTGSDEYSNGVIDDIKIYARPLSTNEINLITGLEKEKLEKEQFNIYPNPANTSIQVRTSCDNIYTEELFVLNSLGETIERFSVIQSLTSIDIHDYVPGIYFVGLKNKSGIKYRKLIVQ